jgi:segregation and condensation protein A
MSSEGTTTAKSTVQEEFDWNVKLPVFEGPLDLLLYLIKKEEIDIYQIPLERITNQYLEIIRLMQMLDLEIAGEFLVMAATLLYIKSRMLLPKDQQMIEPLDEEDDDPRWELIRQLVEYKKFKDAAVQLAVRGEEQEALYQGGFDVRSVPLPPGAKTFETSIFDLITAFQKVLSRVKPASEFDTILEDRFTVSDKIISIQQMIETGHRILFRDLFPEEATRTEIVVTFLALLELIRLRQVLAQQDEAFGEIQLVKSLET